MKILDDTVFPSEEKTITVKDDPIYGGAHCYHIQNCLGFENGTTKYGNVATAVYFIRKEEDGTIVSGVQHEQLAIVMLDSIEKLNARFPSPENTKMVEGLHMFLDACKERVEQRIERGVMGKLKQ